MFVGETPVRRTEAGRTPAMSVIRAAGAGTFAALVVLMVAQSLIQVSWSAGQQLIVLRVLDIVRSGSAAVTGIAFGAAGFASGLAAVTYSRVARRFGYRRLTVTVGLLAGLAIGGVAVTGRASLIVILTGCFGLLYGCVQPAISAMIGLEAPPEVHGRVFGVSSSAVSVGFGAGPLLAGGVAASAGVQAALVVTAAFAVLMSVVMALRGREPRPVGPIVD
jgi:MFS family permease